MTAPAWLSGVFAALMLALAGFCAGRMLVASKTRRPAEVDSDSAHVVMGVAMAGMLASAVRVGTPAMWTVLSGGGAAWFGWQTIHVRHGTQHSAQLAGASGRGAWRCSQPVPHLVKCGAMVYMLLAVHATPSGGTGQDMVMGTTGSRMPIVPLLLAGFMIGYVVLLADRLTQATIATNGAGSVVRAGMLAPRCATMCKMAMGITMAYMLVLML